MRVTQQIIWFLAVMGRFIAFSTLGKVMCGHMKKCQMLCVARAIRPHSDPFKIGIQEMQKLLFTQEQPKAMRSGGWPSVKPTAYFSCFLMPQIQILLCKGINSFLLCLQEETAQFSAVISSTFVFFTLLLLQYLFCRWIFFFLFICNTLIVLFLYNYRNQDSLALQIINVQSIFSKVH